MATEIKLPSLGKKVKSVEVIAIKVAPGAEVAKGQPLLEIESEKGTADFSAPFAGRITKVMVKEGDAIESGQVLFLTDAPDGEPDAAPAEEAKPEAKKKEEAPPKLPEAKAPELPRPPELKPADKKPEPAEVDGRAADGALVRAGPATRRLARKLGVDLRHVRGSGRAGRVTEGDVETYVKNRLTASPAAIAAEAGIEVPELPDFTEWGPISDQPLKAVRRVTAEHMSLCWRLIPHVTQHDEADITDLEAFRQQQKAAGVKVTVTAFALKASAIALKQFPEFNASLDLAGNRLILKKYFHIGVAVDTPHGLLVPVIRDVDRKSVEDLGKELTAVAEAAKQRKADMNGGTFTISNLGGIGGTGFTPIVNWPQVAILGLSRGKLTPVVRDGQVVSRLLLPLSLSYDHRVIDGAAAARFTRFLAEMLENPWKMVLHG
jgi:pyruvate dehydrogenase E2 component (dihydrolipoamide acetyltransferase)